MGRGTSTKKHSGADDKNRCKMEHDAICQLFLQFAFEATAMSPLVSVCKNEGELQDSKSLDRKCLATQVKIVFCAVCWCMSPIMNAVQTEVNDWLLLVSN